MSSIVFRDSRGAELPGLPELVLPTEPEYRFPVRLHDDEFDIVKADKRHQILNWVRMSRIEAENHVLNDPKLIAMYGNTLSVLNERGFRPSLRISYENMPPGVYLLTIDHSVVLSNRSIIPYDVSYPEWTLRSDDIVFFKKYTIFDEQEFDDVDDVDDVEL
jgi:hypothetical protein